MIDLTQVPEKALRSEVARRNSNRRKKRSGGTAGGRPPIPTACKCGAMCPSARAAREHCKSAADPLGK